MKLYKKIIVYLIIILFLSGGVVTGLNPKRQNINDQDGEEIDWWPMFQHDTEHTGASTSPGPDSNNILWKIKRMDDFSSVAIVNKKVYVGGKGYEFCCIDADTGGELWNFSSLAYGFSSPAVLDGKVYFTNFRDVYCLNANTGEEIWCNDTGEYIEIEACPVVANNKVYVVTDDSYCFNASTGEKIWSHENGNVYSPHSPAVWNSKIFTVSESKISNNVFCLNSDTGEEIWSSYIEGGFCNSPTVSNARLYLASNDFKVYCINAETGSEIWNRSIGASGLNLWHSLSIYDNKVYVRSDKMYCLNATTGDEIWSIDIMEDYSSSSPAISDGKIYIGGSAVYCLDENANATIWTYSNSLSFQTSPAIANGKLYIGSNNNELYCFADPLLDIGEINGGFGRIGVELVNPGDDPAINITYTISVKGGLFGNIDIETTKTIPQIKYNITILDYPDIFIFGLGKITIRVSAFADNADIVSKEKEGYVIGPFIFI